MAVQQATEGKTCWTTANDGNAWLYGWHVVVAKGVIHGHSSFGTELSISLRYTRARSKHDPSSLETVSPRAANDRHP